MSLIIKKYRKRMLLLAILFLTVLADILLFSNKMGGNLAIFTFVFLGALFFLYPRLRRDKLAFIVAGLVVVVCASLVVHYKLMQLLLIYFGLTSLVFIANSKEKIDPFSWLVAWIELFPKSIVLWFDAHCSGVVKFTTVFEMDSEKKQIVGVRPQKKVKKRSQLVQWVWVLLVAAVFVGIFCAANPVFEKGVIAFFTGLFKLISMERFIFWASFMIVLWGVFRFTVTKRKNRIMSTANAENSPIFTKFLITFNLIFFVETLLDLVYLFGGTTLPDGMNYATYAHRGAYPLLVAVLLAALFVLRIFSGKKEQRNKLLEKLAVAWMLQSMFLAFTACWRLFLYIDVYGLTLFRVHTIIWLGMVVLGIFWIMVKIIKNKSNNWLLGVNIMTKLAIFMVTVFINFSSLVAWHNVSHSEEVVGTGISLDFEHLVTLGEDAIPAMVWLHGSLNKNSSEKMDKKIVASRKLLLGRVKKELLRLAALSAKQKQTARVWTLQSARYKTLLQQFKQQWSKKRDKVSRR